MLNMNRPVEIGGSRSRFESDQNRPRVSSRTWRFARSLALFTILIGFATGAYADEGESDSGWDSSRPDAHAPIGVMGDHTHKEGEWMLSYRFMTMEMDGMRIGANGKSIYEVLYFPQFSPSLVTGTGGVQSINPNPFNYSAVPIRMRMAMHMFGTMYAPTDSLTLMASVPLIKFSMDHIARNGRLFKTESSGVGDAKVMTLWNFVDTTNHRLHWNFGLSLPTGSLEHSDNTPVALNSELPYPMRTGSGTVDFLPGLTYIGQWSLLSWGAQGQATLRLGENHEDYRLGNHYTLSTWVAILATDWVSFSVRAEGIHRDNISGADADLSSTFINTADPKKQGGEVVRVLGGVNLVITDGLRLALEYGEPVHQHLNGPQLEEDAVFTVGTQYSF